MYDRKVDSNLLRWLPLDLAGIWMKTLAQDETTGAMKAITRLGPGASIPAHRHTHADETVFVVEGDFVEDGVGYGPGSFFVGAAGNRHGPHDTVGGCVLLTTFSATSIL